jgi:hypothetical protein
VVPIGHRLKKGNGQHREIHVVLLNMRGVEGENMKGLVLAEGDHCGGNKNSYEAERVHAANHLWTFLAGANVLVRVDSGLCYV